MPNHVPINKLGSAEIEPKLIKLRKTSPEGGLLFDERKKSKVGYQVEKEQVAPGVQGRRPIGKDDNLYGYSHTYNSQAVKDKENAVGNTLKAPKLFEDVKLNKIGQVQGRSALDDAQRLLPYINSNGYAENNEYNIKPLKPLKFVGGPKGFHPQDLDVAPTYQKDQPKQIPTPTEPVDILSLKDSNLAKVGYSTIGDTNRGTRPESNYTERKNFNGKPGVMYDKSTDFGLIQAMMKGTRSSQAVAGLRKRLQHKEKFADRKSKLSKLMYLS